MIINAYLFMGIVIGMTVGFSFWFHKIRTSHHKKVLSNKKKKELHV